MNSVKITFTWLLFLVATLANAQNEVEMADKFRADGKIYVVLAMILIILGGFITYLIVLDRKIGRLEKRLPDKNRT